MGLLDAMLGGGTKLDVVLDTPQGSIGGVVGGKVALAGGKKPLRLTELSVQLVRITVKTRPDSALPDVKTDVVVKQVLAAGGDLPPGSQQTFPFRFTVPDGLEPSAHDTSYRLLAVADIPSVKDPTASVDLRIVEAEDDVHRLLPVEAIFAKYPDLRSPSEEAQVEALRQLFLDCYSEGSQLMEIEPFLRGLLRTGTVRVRRGALEAWANLVDNRVRPDHLQVLYEVANTPHLDQETFDEVITAACKFAEEGAFALVQQLAAHPDPRIRKQVAHGLRFQAAERFAGKRELLVQLAQDASPETRAAAVGGFSAFRDDPQIVHGVANQLDTDPSPVVQAACLSTLSLAHHHGFADLVYAVFDKHVANPNPEVRIEMASALRSLPKNGIARMGVYIEKLLADGDEDVRAAMAFQFHNLYDFPQFLPLAQRAAFGDPSERVRYEAVGALAALMKAKELVPLYKDLLQRDPSERMHWSVLSGLRRYDDDAQAKGLLAELTRGPFPGVADAARDALTS